MKSHTQSSIGGPLAQHSILGSCGVLAATSAIVSLTVLSTYLGWFSLEPTLTVYLRCNSDVPGTLSVFTIKKNGESVNETVFDLKTSCETGTIEFGGYQSEESLQFIVRRGDDKTHEVIAEYGRDIQVDQSGFYTVLSITDSPSFVANDHI